MDNRLIRDIFKIPLTSSVMECYRILGYNYMYMYLLHVKYSELRLMPHDTNYYIAKLRLKSIQQSLRVNCTYIKLVFSNVLKKNL